MSGQPARAGAPAAGAGGGMFYLLGLIGSAVWWWQQAHGAGEHAVALLKALVWPAFLVYEALRAIHG